MRRTISKAVLSSNRMPFFHGRPGVQVLEHLCQVGMGSAQIHTQLPCGAHACQGLCLSEAEDLQPVHQVCLEPAKECQQGSQNTPEYCQEWCQISDWKELFDAEPGVLNWSPHCQSWQVQWAVQELCCSWAWYLENSPVGHNAGPEVWDGSLWWWYRNCVWTPWILVLNLMMMYPTFF